LLKKFDIVKSYSVDVCLLKTRIITYYADCYIGIPLTLEEHDARVTERLDSIKEDTKYISRANYIP